jgi:hypothetical protein
LFLAFHLEEIWKSYYLDPTGMVVIVLS